MKIIVAAGAFALCAISAHAQPLPKADAVDLGFSPERLRALDAHFEGMIEEGAFPGAILLVARNGQVAHLSTLGKLTPDGPEMSEDAIFRIYSMTKPVVSVAALMLMEQGRLDLGDPLSDYIPEFKDMQVATGPGENGQPATEPAARPITIQDVLRHTTGITYETFGTGPARDAYRAADVGNTSQNDLEVARKLASLPLEHQPGTTWEYGRSTDVLGAVVEVVTGQELSEALGHMIFRPLGMEDTGFVVPPEKAARIAQSTAAEAPAMFDPTEARAFESGNIGLVSTVHDYARFGQMLLNGGEIDGVRLLAPKTVSFMTSDHLAGLIQPGKYYLPGPGYRFGLGVGVRIEEGVAPFVGSVGEYNWGGRAGTYWWNDPAEDLMVVYMMQSAKNRTIIRAPLKNMVYGALVNEAD